MPQPFEYLLARDVIERSVIEKGGLVGYG
jgi:hypothetical protein